MNYRLIFSVIILGTVIIFTGCPKKKVQTTPPPTTAGPASVTQLEPEEPEIRGPVEFSTIPELQNINFGYDKFDITPEAGKILQSNADYLKLHPELEILVEGHCCECGTNEYNLALGQKRAQAVRDYYIKLGIPASDIATISYGEEKPININAGPPDSPRCVPNRRAETKVRLKKSK